MNFSDRYCRDCDTIHDLEYTISNNINCEKIQEINDIYVILLNFQLKRMRNENRRLKMYKHMKLLKNYDLY